MPLSFITMALALSFMWFLCVFNPHSPAVNTWPYPQYRLFSITNPLLEAETHHLHHVLAGTPRSSTTPARWASPCSTTRPTCLACCLTGAAAFCHYPIVQTCSALLHMGTSASSVRSILCETAPQRITMSCSMCRYNIPWRGDAFTNDTTVDGGDLTGGWIGGGTTSE